MGTGVMMRALVKFVLRSLGPLICVLECGMLHAIEFKQSY